MARGVVRAPAARAERAASLRGRARAMCGQHSARRDRPVKVRGLTPTSGDGTSPRDAKARPASRQPAALDRSARAAPCSRWRSPTECDGRGGARLRRRALPLRAGAAASRHAISSGSRSASRSSSRSTSWPSELRLAEPARGYFCTHQRRPRRPRLPDGSAGARLRQLPRSVVQASPSKAAVMNEELVDVLHPQAARRAASCSSRATSSISRSTPWRSSRTHRRFANSTRTVELRRARTATAPGRCAKCGARNAACASGACATVASVRRRSSGRGFVSSRALARRRAARVRSADSRVPVDACVRRTACDGER